MNIFEESYPGNASVLEKLLASMKSGGVTAFTGAGTSMPSLPGWEHLVRGLIDDAQKEGALEENIADALRRENQDFLYVIDEIYGAVGESQTKTKVSKLFASLKAPTEAHRLIAKTKFDRIMTLNYDKGLEMAYAEQHSQHIGSIATSQQSEVDEWLRNNGPDEATPILHWHGTAGNANSIVLSGSDYVNFYDNAAPNKETLRSIFKTRRILLVGFGFTDPFIERELNSVMQPLMKSNSHFAIIGLYEDSGMNIQVERRKYSSKYKLETIFYPVRGSEAGPDHSALIEILNTIASAHPYEHNASVPTPALVSTQPNARDATVSHRSTLFTIGDKPIYCEPNLWIANDEANGVTETKITLADLMSGNYHCNITAPHEYGLSNLGRRIVSDLTVAGKRAIFRDARGFPKYRKAIQADPDFASITSDDSFVLVLDNFFVVDHQRTIRELLGTYRDIRIVVLQKSNLATSPDEGLAELKFKSFNLRGLSRSDIRAVLNIIGPHYNSDDTSAIVDKVYSDLLQLCIPLTPSNVIMYSSVLCKDGSFSPVSRLHIVDRFVAEALQRASDAYAASFNFINKIDLICEFCFGLFTKNAPTFSEADWSFFCKKYKTNNLVDFSHTEILGDLLSGRIVIKDGNVYAFRYRMFFSYFVGSHIAARPDLLTACLTDNRHLALDGLIEVLCGMLTDCSPVLDDLTKKLSLSLESFYESYPIRGLDFHENAKWEFNEHERELWEAVSDRLEKGPVGTHELDELKTSIQAERRTDDQKVSIIKFIASEKSVTNNAWHLSTALESAKQAGAESKKAATTAVINGYMLAYEVASVFVPLIAERKYVSWNGFTYINLIEDKREGGDSANEETHKERMRNLVAYWLPTSMGGNAADLFGSRKLGQVFLALVDDSSPKTSIMEYLLFCLLVRSKPNGWLASAKKRVRATKRDDLYLKHMLGFAMRQFRDEINTEIERQELKELIASIRLRRDANVKSPSATAIKEAIGKLDAHGIWNDEKPDTN